MKKHTPDLCTIALIIVIYLMSTLLTGCISSKNVQKEKTQTQVEAQASETHNSVTNIQDTSITRATNTTRTVETIDTSAKIPGSKITGEQTVGALKKGKDLIIDNGDQQVRVYWDPESKTVVATGTVKDRTVQVKGKREMTSSGSSITNEAKKTSILDSGTKETKLKSTVTTESKDKQITFSQKWIWIVLAIVCAVILVGFLAFKFLKL